MRRAVVVITSAPSRYCLARLANGSGVISITTLGPVWSQPSSPTASTPRLTRWPTHQSPTCGAQVLVAGHDLLAVRDHLLGREAGIDLQVAQRAVEAVDMLLQAERLAVEGARHVEGAVAVLPAAVAERNHDLAFGHELAVEPGDALIAELLGHGVSPDLARVCRDAQRRQNEFSKEGPPGRSGPARRPAERSEAGAGRGQGRADRRAVGRRPLARSRPAASCRPNGCRRWPAPTR